MRRRRTRAVLRSALGMAAAAVTIAVPLALATAPPAAAAPPPEILLVQPATTNGCLAADPDDPSVARLRQCGTDNSFHWVHEWNGTLRNTGRDRCLSATVAQGATPRLEPCSGSSTTWDPKQQAGGHDILRARGTDLCIDFPDSISLGSVPRLWTCQGPRHHDWALFRLSDKPHVSSTGIVHDCGGRTIAEWEAEGHTVRFAGTSASEVICGTVREDSIIGLGGDDRIFGGLGADTVSGGGGADVIWSGPGDDSVHGGDGDDDINGGLGSDLLRGAAGDDVLVGGAGDDELHGDDNDDKLIGFGGSDHLWGESGYDSLCDTDGKVDVLDGGTSTEPGLFGAEHLDHAYFDLYPYADTLMNIEVPGAGDPAIDPIDDGYASDTGQPNIRCFVMMGLATGSSDALSAEDTLNFSNPEYGGPGPSHRQLTVDRVGAGALTVTSNAGSPDSFSCMTPTDSCSARFPSDSIVTLTVAPTPGSVFTGWSGLPCTSPTPDVCTLVMTNDLTLTASFEPTRHRLTVARTGAGQGTVTAAQEGRPVPGFTCETDGRCSGTVAYGQEIVLTATPDDYHTFVRWEGPICTGGATGDQCRFTLESPEDATVLARFGLSKRVIGVEIPDGAGTGTVNAVDSTGQPVPGFACKDDRGTEICGVEVDYGTLVTFTGTPAAGRRPATWSGAPCEPGSPVRGCTVAAIGPDRSKLGPDLTLVATFAPAVRHTLTRTIGGNGSVTAVDEAGRDAIPGCAPAAATCSAEVLEGAVITLTASPSSGATFQGWDGPCAPGTAAEICEVTVDGDESVTATFRTTSSNPLASVLAILQSLLGGLLGKP